MNRVDKTNILPLRWIANVLSYPAIRSLSKAFDLQEQDNLGYRFKFHCFVWKHLYKPYQKWGTYYTMDIKAWREEMSGSGWDDRDENGVAYWEKSTDGESKDS